MARYKMFFSESDFLKIIGKEGKVIEGMVEDGETLTQFQAKLMLSRSPQEGYVDVAIMSDRGRIADENWYIKLLESGEVEDDAVTIFESMRLGDRKGYMLRSMMAEEKSQAKKDTMSIELQKRLKRKQEIVKELLQKEDSDKNNQR